VPLKLLPGPGRPPRVKLERVDAAGGGHRPRQGVRQRPGARARLERDRAGRELEQRADEGDVRRVEDLRPVGQGTGPELRGGGQEKEPALARAGDGAGAVLGADPVL
jgi:hypothetical protein